MSTFGLQGRTILISGGGTGIGLGVARCLADEGANVALVGRRLEVLELAVSQLTSQALAVQGDVTNESHRRSIVERAIDRFGTIDGFVHCAGGATKRAMADSDSKLLTDVLNVHVIAGAELARLCLPLLKTNGGSVIFVGSVAAHIGMASGSAYSTAKAALKGLTLALSAEWAKDDIRVNLVTPGWIDTPMTADVFANDPARLSRVIQRTPQGRVGLPADVGWMVTYLLSDLASFVTGGEFFVDGGAHSGF